MWKVVITIVALGSHHPLESRNRHPTMALCNMELQDLANILLHAKADWRMACMREDEI